MPFKNLENRKEFRRKWYAKNKGSEKAHVKRRKNEIKKWFEDYKRNLKCSNCAESHPAIIDFHHEGHRKKEREISFMVANGYSVDKIKDELKKCRILCANCHRKLHWRKNKNL